MHDNGLEDRWQFDVMVMVGQILGGKEHVFVGLAILELSESLILWHAWLVELTWFWTDIL